MVARLFCSSEKSFCDFLVDNEPIPIATITLSICGVSLTFFNHNACVSFGICVFLNSCIVTILSTNNNKIYYEIFVPEVLSTLVLLPFATLIVTLVALASFSL